MANQNTKTVILHEDERKPFRLGHYIPLRQMAGDVLIRGTCLECGLEHTQTVSQMVMDGSICMATVDDLEDLILCRRESCRGDMLFEIDEANSANLT